MSHLFYSFVNLIIALFFICTGIVVVALPWSPEIRESLIQFILKDSLVLSFFGLAFIVVGLALFMNILLSARRRYYYVKSSEKDIAVDEAVIQQYLNQYWKQLFPNQDIPNRAFLKKNQIYISADLPHVPHSEQGPLLERIKQDLENIFGSILEYNQEFHLTISFQEPA